MAEKFSKSAVPVDFKVTLVNAKGQHLAQDDNGIFFSGDRSRAMVFSYYADRIQEQIELLSRTETVHLAAEPVPIDEVYERCDGCAELFHPTMIWFDGSKFMCPECAGHKAPSAGKAGAKQPKRS